METNETSIKKLLQDHPGSTIIIRLSYGMKDVVNIIVIDAEHDLALDYGILDLMFVQKSPEQFSGLPIGYDELLKKIDEKIKEEYENNV